jgi:hypothetical protein
MIICESWRVVMVFEIGRGMCTFSAFSEKYGYIRL